MDVIQNIIAIRREKGLNQDVIADALNIDTSAASKIESGNRQLKVSELAKIADALNEDVVYLFTYPKRFVDKDLLKIEEKVSVTFEVSPDKRDYLLSLINDQHDGLKKK